MTTPREFFSISKNGDSTTSPANLYQFSVILIVARVFPDVRREPLEFPFVPAAFGLVTGYHWKGPVLHAPSLQMVLCMDGIPLVFLFSILSSSSSQPLLTGEMLQCHLEQSNWPFTGLCPVRLYVFCTGEPGLDAEVYISYKMQTFDLSILDKISNRILQIGHSFKAFPLLSLDCNTKKMNRFPRLWVPWF